KPLVWARHGGGVTIASEAKALFALGVPARWDDEMFFHAAHTQYVWPDRTLWSTVRQVPPRSLLVVSRGEVATWELDVPLPTCSLGVRGAREEAVRLRTVADAPVAVQLSGGLDSTTVAALAVRARPDVRAFTVGFDDGYDERRLAAATARSLGVPLEVVPL